MKLVTARQMKEIDEKMIRDYKISALILMEKAGTGVARVILQLLDGSSWPRKVVLFAGRGNNGGDAFVAARVLEENNVKTQTLLLSAADEIKGDAKENFTKLKSRGGLVHEIKSVDDLNRVLGGPMEASIAVDGIVGTGSKGALQGLFADAADKINSMNYRCVVAIDIPSGLDPVRGVSLGPTVRADHTVTLGLPKIGLVAGEGLEWTGALHIVDLGIPPLLLKSVDTHEFLLTPGLLTLPARRRRLSHKGTYGHLLVLGGSPGFTGAPSLTALAALRAGAGLVTVGIAESLNPILEVKLTEPMTLPLPEGPSGFIGLKALDPLLQFLKRASAVAIGPGLSTQEETVKLVLELITRLEIPAVIDADALNAIAQDLSHLKKAKSQFILTPHPGEMSRLTGQSKTAVQGERWDVARKFSKEFNVITVLKGAGTVITEPDGNLFVNVTGNPGMATGGMGDVLTGIIGGLLAQGIEPVEAAKLGVYVHGLCGDEVALQRGYDQGILASDLLDYIPKKMHELQNRP